MLKCRILRKFAWWPTKMTDGSRVWLDWYSVEIVALSYKRYFDRNTGKEVFKVLLPHGDSRADLVVWKETERFIQ